MVHFLVHGIGAWLAKWFFVGRKASVGRGTRLNLFSRASNESGEPKSIQIGEFGLMFGELVTEKQGRIKIGKYVEIEPHTILRAMDSIQIGDYCKIAEQVYIHDNNSHPTDLLERRQELIDVIEGKPLARKGVAHAPIKIENDVFIGRRAMIYKGVTVGQGSIIAAGAVVTKDIPPYSLAAGNPAVVVKTYPHPHDAAKQT